MTTTTKPVRRGPVLSDSVLGACHERAAFYDRENRFFSEDFEELRQSGYLVMAVPEEFGGLGMNLADVMKETRRLAYFAPATAVALNMHIYWTGLSADLLRFGDRSMEWLLREAGAGEIFAAGHAESGNDVPVVYSTTKAVRTEGGWRFTGRKSFGSLSPIWTRFGLHGMDASDPDNPIIVHAFLPRDSDGFEIVQVWDSLGMRATQSQDTVLADAFVPERYVARVLPAGMAGADQFVLGVFVWPLMGFANVYYAIAQRAFDIVVESTKRKSSVALSRTMAYHPEIQHVVAEMKLALDSIGPQLDSFADDWSSGVQGRDYAADITSAKHNATEGAFRIVDQAMDIAGGFAVNKRSELERLFRDARMGRIHPSNSALTHEIVAKSVLGIDFDDPKRWG